MLRTIKIGAIVAVANVVGIHAAGAQTLTWGIFRENATDITESARNCWTQAMVSGSTINGELMEQGLTQQKAQFELQKLARQGQCSAERSGPSWSARGERHDHHWWNNGGGGGNNGSDSDQSDTDADASQSAPSGGSN
jgi:hypothetical protein